MPRRFVQPFCWLPARAMAFLSTCERSGLANYEQNGGEGLQEGVHTGRPPALDCLDRRILADILDSGPVAYGFLSGVWTSPMISRLIAE